jgi:hypothetical protein
MREFCWTSATLHILNFCILAVRCRVVHGFCEGGVDTVGLCLGGAGAKRPVKRQIPEDAFCENSLAASPHDEKDWALKKIHRNDDVLPGGTCIINFSSMDKRGGNESVCIVRSSCSRSKEKDGRPSCTTSGFQTSTRQQSHQFLR